MRIYTINSSGHQGHSNGGMFKIKRAGGSLRDGGGDDGSVVWEVVEASARARSKSSGGVFKIKKAGGSLREGGSDDGTIVWEIVEACANNSIPPELLEWQPGRENAVALGASLAAQAMATAASGDDDRDNGGIIIIGREGP